MTGNEKDDLSLQVIALNDPIGRFDCMQMWSNLIFKSIFTHLATTYGYDETTHVLGNQGNVWRSFVLVDINIHGYAIGVAVYQRCEFESCQERIIYIYINLKSDLYDSPLDQSFVEHGWHNQYSSA